MGSFRHATVPIGRRLAVEPNAAGGEPLLLCMGLFSIF